MVIKAYPRLNFTPDLPGSYELTHIQDKKPLNVSLYILGEYDILNDLVNDGAKRLRDNREASDLDLLLQNNPCPPPNRWVRSTGWGKCNPSSMYAKDPPKDFDWVRYYDTLRVKTVPRKRENVATNKTSEDEKMPATSTDTQTTDATAAVSMSEDFDSDEHHRDAGGRLLRVTRAGSDAARAAAMTPAEQAQPSASALAATSRPTAGAGARSHFNQPKKPASRAQSEGLSVSERPPRKSHVRATSDATPLSTSERKPRGGGLFRRKKSGAAQ